MTQKNYPWLEHYPDRPDWHMNIAEASVLDALKQTVQANPDQEGFECLGKSWTWEQLDQQIKHFAAGLQKQGVKKGDKVGLFMPNCSYFFIAYYSVLSLGAVVVNYNPLYAEQELAHQIEDSETDMMITLDLALTYDKARQMLSGTRLKDVILCRFTDILPFPKNMLFRLFKSADIGKVSDDERVHWYQDIIKNDGIFDAPQINVKKDLAVLQYTGGTTGVPKGAMLTHWNIYANAVQCLVNFPETEQQPTMLTVLPFFHVFAMTVCLNMAVMAGMKILTIPRFNLDEALKLIQSKRPNYMPAVPAIFGAINTHKKLDQFDLSSLEFCISGGAPLPVEVKRAFESKTGCVVVEGYGLTESSPVATVNPPRGDNVAGSIGLPLPGTIIEIIDPEDKKTPMAIGDRGEVCITGPQVMKGYYKRTDATNDVLKDGRLYTGDIGIMDDKGYVYIVDRIKDLIITNGYNVYPRHVEEAIYQHPNVEECIVAGLPDQKRGEIVKAWIKLKEGRELSTEDLKNFLSNKISKIEMPKRIEFRSEPLPKTMIGKLSRKDIVAEELGQSE